MRKARFKIQCMSPLQIGFFTVWYRCIQDMRDAVVSVYENRKNLALTLKDTRTVVGKLENILGVGIHGVCFLFYLSIFNVGSCPS